MTPRPPSPDSGRRAPRGGPTARPSTHGGGDRAGIRAEPAVHRLYARLAWTTLGRLPLVAPGRVLRVEAQIITLCRRLDVEPVEVRAGPDRLDLLVRFKPVHPIADVAAAVKAGSADHLARAGTPIRWAPGVAVATVGPAGVRPLVRRMTAAAGPG